MCDILYSMKLKIATYQILCTVLPSAMGKSMYAVLGLWLGHLFDEVP